MIVWLTAAGLAIAGLAFLLWDSNSVIEVTTYEVRSQRIPAAFEGCTIVQLSDLHNRRFGARQERLVKAVRQANPDLIAVTGDLVSGGLKLRRRAGPRPGGPRRGGAAPAAGSACCVQGAPIPRRWRSSLELIGRLRGMAPVYYVTGNHEIHSGLAEALVQRLEALGVRVLRARSELIERPAPGERAADGAGRGAEGAAGAVRSVETGPPVAAAASSPASPAAATIAVAGIDDPQAFGPRRSTRALRSAPAHPAKPPVGGWAVALAELRRTADPGRYTVLLSHRPECLREYCRLGFDLVLAGHTHGGQLRLPIGGVLWVPDQGLRPRYVSGYHRVGETTLVISRGLGSGPFTFRLFNRPELVVVRLSGRPHRRHGSGRG